MSITSTTYVDAFQTIQGEPPWLYGFPFPEPFEERVFSAGYTQNQNDPQNKVLFMSNTPKTYEKLAPPKADLKNQFVDPLYELTEDKARSYEHKTIRV